MAALVALGFALRTTNAAEVFVGGAVVLPENDPYYQVHRVLQALASYPALPLVDPLLDHPHGAAPIWPPLYPWLLASFLAALGASAAEPRLVETALALSTPALGALVCVPVWALARRILDGPGAWLAATLAVLVPAHLWYSRLGFVDHHAAVTLVQVALFLAALVALEERRSFGWLAATLALGMLLWNGFVLFVAILDLYLLVVLLLAEGAERRRVARLVAWSHAVAAVVILPCAALQVGATGAPWGTFALSFLHPAVLAAVAVGAAVVAASPDRAGRWLCGAAVAGAAVGLATGALGEAVGWIFGRDDFMSSIQEVVPIFLRSDGTLDLEGPTIWLTRFWLVVPLLLALAAYQAFAGARVDRGRVLLVVWGSALFLLALRQRRFAESFAPALAVLVALGLRETHLRVRRALTGRGWADLAAQGASAALTLAVALYGLGPYYGPILRHPGGLLALAYAATEEATPRRLPPSHRSLARLAEIARTSSPDPERRAVMNLWPLGHRILYLTKLPVVASPFGSHIGGESFDDATAFFLSTDEGAAVELLDDRGVRWIVVDDDLGTVGAALRARGEPTGRYYAKTIRSDGGVNLSYRPPLLRTLYLRLVLLAGGASPDTGVPPLEHFRLVVDAEADHVGGHPKVFERVDGAHLRLRGRPGSEYELRYEFRSDAGRDRAWATVVRTDAGGGADVRLPYSSERPDLGQTAQWRIRGPGADRRLHVPEQAVTSGETLSVDLGSFF